MKPKQKNIVGVNIKKWRLKHGLTQEGLALESGLSQGYINQLESGKKGYSQDVLEKITNILKISIASLFEEIGNDGLLVKETEGFIYTKKEKINKNELWKIFNKLPPEVGKHYFLLMKIEIKIRSKE